MKQNWTWVLIVILMEFLTPLPSSLNPQKPAAVEFFPPPHPDGRLLPGEKEND